MAIFAHQGGWDELLLVAAPVAVIAGLLVLADKRAKRALDATSVPPAGDPARPQGARDEDLDGDR